MEELQGIAAKAAEYGIPDHMIGGISRYINHKIPTGGFMRCILEGRLEDAEHSADAKNQGLSNFYWQFLQQYAPKECFGNREKVSSWLASK